LSLPPSSSPYYTYLILKRRLYTPDSVPLQIENGGIHACSLHASHFIQITNQYLWEHSASSEIAQKSKKKQKILKNFL